MESESDVCLVCLAPSTALYPLGEYSQLYKMLSEKEKSLDYTVMKPFTCSDCQDMFQKIQLFQLKIQNSYECLLRRINSDPGLTSNSIGLKSEYKAIHNIEIEVDTEYLKGDEDCKDEPFDYDNNIENHFDVDDNLVDIKQEPEDDDDKTNFKIEEVKEESNEQNVIFNSAEMKKKKKYYKRPSENVKLNVVSGKDLLKKKFRYYSKKRCDNKSNPKKLHEGTRYSWAFKYMKFRCRTCLIGFHTNEDLEKHMSGDRHTGSVRPYTCDICDTRTKTKKSLEKHVREHYYYYTCVLCKQTQQKKWQIRLHFEVKHKRIYECPKCGFITIDRREYFNHYRSLHLTFICDYCGKVYHKTKWIVKHIKNIHTQFECKPCNKKFKYFRNYDFHLKLLHTTAFSESTYCVECDIRFENIIRYKRHINNSPKHLGRNRKKSANCPECGKLYACRNNMMNHYKLEHLKVTNYQCKDCDRFFLNSYRLKEHRLVNHEKKGRAKNKICTYCGRGFSNNRILMYHVRTHTGERPHACEYCTATFAQPFALHTHVKARHKDALK